MLLYRRTNRSRGNESRPALLLMTLPYAPVESILSNSWAAFPLSPLVLYASASACCDASQKVSFVASVVSNAEATSSSTCPGFRYVEARSAMRLGVTECSAWPMLSSSSVPEKLDDPAIGDPERGGDCFGSAFAAKNCRVKSVSSPLVCVSDTSCQSSLMFKIARISIMVQPS